MANADKDLIVTPARNSAELDPYITFVGANTTTNAIINMFMYPDSNGTISFEGSAGQLFSITNDLSGVLYSINDELAVSQFNVSANGLNVLSANGGNTTVGTSTKTANLTVYGTLTANTLVVPSTSTANLTVTDNLIVGGNLTVSGTTTTINTQNLLANDSVILLNSGQSTALNDAGWILQRYSAPTISNYNVGLTWNEAADRLVVGRTQNQGNTSSVAYSNEWMTILGTNGYVGFGGNTNPITTVTIDGPVYNALGITNSTSTSKKLLTFSVGAPGNYDDYGLIQFDGVVKANFTTSGTAFNDQTISFGRYLQGASAGGNVIDFGGSPTGYVDIRSSYGGIALKTTTNTYPILILTNNLERMRVDGNGFIGIGTTTPAANLHVAGNSRFESGTTAGATVGQIGIKTTDGGLAYVGIQGGSWNALGLWAPSGSLAGNPGLSIGGSQITLSQPIGHYSSSITFNPRGDIGASAPGVLINSGGTGVKTFAIKAFASQTANLTEWQSSTGTTLSAISANGDFTTTANVGIGVTPGTSKLEVLSTAATSPPLQIARFRSSTSTFGTTNESNSVVSIVGFNGSNNREIRLGLGVPTTYGAHDVCFLEFGASSMWSTGDGIWKWSSNGAFSIGGVLYKGYEWYNHRSDNQNAFVFHHEIPSGGGDTFKIYSAKTSNLTTPVIRVNSAGGANFVVLNNGNTGIGISLPTANLHVVGTTTISGQANVGIVKTNVYTVATLPAAATAGAGARAYVSDSNTTTYLSIVGGSGANGVLVFSNGTNWLLG